MSVLQVAGIVKIVQFSGQPVAIPDWQINNLKILVGAGVMIENDGRTFQENEEVMITTGSLEGLRGIITRVGSRKKLIISIPYK